MAEGDDGEHHGEHLAGDGHGHEEDRGEGRESVDCGAFTRQCSARVSFCDNVVGKGRSIERRRERERVRGRGRERLTYEDLSDGATGCEAQDIRPDARVSRHECQRVLELAGAAHDVHAQPLADARVDQPGAQDQVRGHDGHAHEIVGAHHLGARVGLEGAEDVVLRAVREAVEQEVDAQQQQPPGAVPLGPGRPVALALLARVQGEDGDAGRHGGHDHVLVERVALAEDGDVEEHDG